jgi:hypothetical protein
MATTSFHTEEDFTELVAPDEDVMLERRGRDRRGLRREIAPLTELERGTRKIEEGDGMYVDAKSDMPEGTTSVGEVLGNVDIVRYVGDDVLIPRMTHGLTVDAEDLEIDNAQNKVSRAQDALMEMFDIQADLQFLLGITDEEGNEVQPGVFDWLDDNIPSGNVINAGATEYDSFRLSNDGQPSNIIQRAAYETTEGIYADDAWDFAMYDHGVRALWNTIDANSGVQLKSQFMDLGDDAQGVGSSIVGGEFLIPSKTGLRTAPDAADTLQFDITGNLPTATNGDNDDVMYLIPDHGGDFFEVYEHPEPTLIQEPIRKNGGALEYEYYWRAGQAYGFGSHETDDGAGGSVAHDVVKIENVSTLF